MKAKERKEVFDEMYAAIQRSAVAINDYKIHSSFVGVIAENFAEESLKKVEQNADILKDCVKRLREGKNADNE